MIWGKHMENIRAKLVANYFLKLLHRSACWGPYSDVQSLLQSWVTQNTDIMIWILFYTSSSEIHPHHHPIKEGAWKPILKKGNLYCHKQWLRQLGMHKSTKTSMCDLDIWQETWVLPDRQQQTRQDRVVNHHDHFRVLYSCCHCKQHDFWGYSDLN